MTNLPGIIKKVNKRNLYIFIVFFMVVFMFLIVKTFDTFVEVKQPFYIEFNIDNSKTEKINLWEDGGEYYLFLPNNLSKFVIKTNYDNVLINNTSPYSFDLTSANKDEDYTVSFDKYNKKLHIIKTSNISTMYIDSSQSFECLERDKNYKLSIGITLYDEMGKLNYLSTNDSIKGRGNSTWTLDKKPFVLTLENEESMLGMAKSNKYILLANAFDKSNIKNKLVFDFAEQLNFIWSPHGEYVDLYINGDYNGLYLLCEKISIDKYAYNGNSILFSWALKTQNNNNSFISNYSTCFQVEYPTTIDTNIRNKINELEESIRNDNGWQDKIDAESFARKYLIEELFGNWDFWSLYFYYDGDKYYAEPVWDYDHACGKEVYRIRSPYLIEMNNEKYLNGISDGTWFYYLNKNINFKKLVVEVYEKEFLPIINVINEDIEKYKCLLENSGYANDVRWNRIFSSFELNPSIPSVSDYMKARIDFMSNIIINNTDYYRVNVKLKNTDYVYTTIYGDTLSEVVDFNDLYDLKDNAKFFYADTNEVVDISAKIDRDIIIYTNDVKTINGIKEGKGLLGKLNQYRKPILATLLLVVITIFSLILAKVERRNIHGK